MRRHENLEPHRLRPGEYCCWNSIWYCCTPNGHLGSLRKHAVTEHEDGTISVHPSIKVSFRRTGADADAVAYHGWLERGIWRDA